jgi:hypothetical protein
MSGYKARSPNPYRIQTPSALALRAAMNIPTAYQPAYQIDGVVSTFPYLSPENFRISQVTVIAVTITVHTLASAVTMMMISLGSTFIPDR